MTIFYEAALRYSVIVSKVKCTLFTNILYAKFHRSTLQNGKDVTIDIRRTNLNTAVRKDVIF